MAQHGAYIKPAEGRERAASDFLIQIHIDKILARLSASTTFQRASRTSRRPSARLQTFSTRRQTFFCPLRIQSGDCTAWGILLGVKRQSVGTPQQEYDRVDQCLQFSPVELLARIALCAREDTTRSVEESLVRYSN